MHRAARSFVAPVAALLLAVSAAPGATDAGNPAAAVAEAAGHPSRLHLRAESGTAGADLATLDVEGTRRLERSCAADLCTGSWFDGSLRFTFGINGTPYPERADAAERTFAAIASTAFAEPSFIAGGGRVVPAAPGAAGERRFSVTAAGGSELVAVADRRSAMLVAIDRPDGSRMTPLFASGHPPDIVFAERSYERVASTGDTLLPPPGPALHVEGERQIPLLPGPLPLLRCRLGGRDAVCLIDSGTTPSAVTLGFAEQLGREPRGTIAIEGLGSFLTGVVDGGPLELGGATVAGLHFAVIPRVHGAAFDAIVGSDALASVRIAIDATHHRLTIASAGTALEGDVIPLVFRSGLPYADGALGSPGRIEPLLVDTGDSGTVSIGYAEYDRDPGLFAPGGHSQASGVGERITDTIDGNLAELDVGPVRLRHVPIAAVRGEHGGHLGYGFASRCALFTLDLGRRRIGCERSSASESGADTRQPDTRR